MKRKAERQSRILAELEGAPSLRVAELARRMEVSTETIRRDLDEMTARRLLDRTYGGAIRPTGEEPTLSVRHALFIEERQRIAEAAVAQLSGARVIMIGSGATATHVARRIAAEMGDLTVVTHAVGVAQALTLNPSIRVILAPGDYHAGEGATVGARTSAFLAGFRADVAVLGASGLGPDGPSDALIDVSSVYEAICAQAARVLLVADHSKFGQIFPARYAPWTGIDRLVTDRAPEGALAGWLAEARVALSLAPQG